MKTTKKKAGTAKNSAIIIALAAATGASIQSTNAAAKAAMQDMEKEFGKDAVYGINYVYDPFDGMIA